MASPELAQWEITDQRRRVLFKSVTAGDEPNQLYYLLGVGDMGGLFQYTIPEDLERRLMFSAHYVHPTGLSYALNPKQEIL